MGMSVGYCEYCGHKECRCSDDFIGKHLEVLDKPMKKKKKVVKGEMRARTYVVLRAAVEDGVAYGYNRAFKHTDTPDEHDVKEAIVQAVLNECCEWFRFDEEDE